MDSLTITRKLIAWHHLAFGKQNERSHEILTGKDIGLPSAKTEWVFTHDRLGKLLSSLGNIFTEEWTCCWEGGDWTTSHFPPRPQLDTVTFKPPPPPCWKPKAQDDSHEHSSIWIKELLPPSVVCKLWSGEQQWPRSLVEMQNSLLPRLKETSS